MYMYNYGIECGHLLMLAGPVYPIRVCSRYPCSYILSHNHSSDVCQCALEHGYQVTLMTLIFLQVTHGKMTNFYTKVLLVRKQNM